MDKYKIDTFFDVTYKVVNNVPKISIKLKSEFKNKTRPSVNGNSLKYYVYYLGIEKGAEVYDLLRPLMAYHNRIKWYIKEYHITDPFLLNYYDEYERNRINSIRKARLDPELQARIKQIANLPERKQKISEAAKSMWARFRDNDTQKLRNMVHSSNRKNFNCNGYDMNSIEFILASLLNSLGVEFEYESVYVFENKTYIPDFYIRDYNLIIECFGDYWHANPKFYTSKDVVFRNPVSNIYERDDLKRLNFENRGYQYIVFWEYDLRNNLEEIKQQLCNILKKK